MNQCHILIVDDDEPFVESTTELLERNGYRVSVCMSYNEVLNVLNQQKIDLILLDIMLHEFDGRAIARLIENHQDHSHIPIVFTTVLDEKEHQLANTHTVLSKPFRIRELLEIIVKITDC